MPRRWIRRGLLFALIGVLATVAIAFISAALFELSSTPVSESASGFDGRVEWNVQVARTRTGVRVSSQRDFPPWSVDQATGPPNTARSGDERTAWASATPDGQTEWLEVDYAVPVIPLEAHIYETYNPGAVTKVWLIDPRRNASLAWSGSDPARTVGAIAISKIDVSPQTPVVAIRIELDSISVKGWNEIDTIGLKDQNGVMHWPVRARASSVYGSRTVTAPSVRPAILPSWGGLDEPALPFAGDGTTSETRAVEGRGWPMIALWAKLPDAASIPPPVMISGATFIPSGSPGPGGSAAHSILPRRVVWRGLLVDTLLFAFVAAALWWLVTAPTRFLIESGRIRRGCCLRCGYNLRYEFKTGCPECGWQRDGSSGVAGD